MKNLLIKPVPIPSGADHPEPPHHVLPKHEFSMGFIAPKGSGKTTTLINLLLFYKGYFNNIIIMSPTIENDEKWDHVKKQPLLAENVALKEFKRELKEQSRTDNGVVRAPSQAVLDVEEDEEFDPYIPAKCFITDFTTAGLKEILDEQNSIVKMLKSHGKTKHLANRVLLVFDDQVGSNLFGNQRDNLFKMLNCNHRHGSFSLLCCVQSYKELPKTVRNQQSCFIIFEIPNDAEVKVIYEENSMKLKQVEWMEVYEHCTRKEFSFLFLNYQQKKGMRIMRNFTDYIKTANDIEDESDDEVTKKRLERFTK